MKEACLRRASPGDDSQTDGLLPPQTANPSPQPVAEPLAGRVAAPHVVLGVRAPVLPAVVCAVEADVPVTAVGHFDAVQAVGGAGARVGCFERALDGEGGLAFAFEVFGEIGLGMR